MNILNKITVIIIDLLHSSCQTLGGLVLCTKPQNKILGRLQHLVVKDHEDEGNFVESSVFCTFNDDNVDENALLIIFLPLFQYLGPAPRLDTSLRQNPIGALQYTM